MKILLIKIIKTLQRTSCSSSSSRSSLGSFLRMTAVQEREGELSQDSAEHAELAEDIDKESRWRSRRSLSRPLSLWSPGLNLMSSKQRGSLSSDVVTWLKKRNWNNFLKCSQEIDRLVEINSSGRLIKLPRDNLII